MTSENGTKEFDPDRVESRSVIEQPEKPSSRNPVPSYDSYTGNIYYFVSQYVDDIVPWGRSKQRDIQLREFILKEPIFASALGIIASRNAGFSWKLEGPPRTVTRLQEIFDMANLGEGWHDLILKTSIDLYTQDYGAFWEIVREKNTPTSPVIGINHLDAARCYHTGVREAPVVYMDRKSKYHLMNWWNVVTFADMPSPMENMYGMQFCALSRILMAVQTQRNINILNNEKTGGRDTQAIHLLKGVTTRQIDEAMAQARAMADAAGRLRWTTPVVVGTLDPTADVGHDTIEMAGLPTAYDEKTAFAQYINIIAMGFESDYQEFAPLPGAGIGTSAQSEMLHLKSRGKGPGLFMKLIAHAINFRILPQNARFTYTEQDLEAEMQLAEVKAMRAQTRSVRIASMEITPQVARQMANDEGDLPEELMALMGEEDVTEDVTVRDDINGVPEVNDTGKPLKPGVPAPQAGGARPKRPPVISPPTPLGPKLR